MGTPAVTARRWKRVEYERLVDTGVFRPGERVELVGGELLVREPQGSPHATAVGLVEDALRVALGAAWVVRVQMPVALDADSEPEPDIAVVPGARRDFRDTHPTRPALIVEVAAESLAFDRHHKGSLYARAKVPDYWIVNLVRGILEVRRQPTRRPSARFGWHYRAVQMLGPSALVSPLAAPGARIAVADLLP